MTSKEIQGIDPDAWVGRTMAAVCHEFGNPDLVQPASHYGAKFHEAKPTVALTYRDLGHRWFINEDARVAAVLRIKE